MKKYIVNLEEKHKEHVLTKTELKEHLDHADTTVNQVERIQVDEEFINEQIDASLREAFSEILSHHELSSGDIAPMRDKQLEDAKDDLKGHVKGWIGARIQ